MDRCLRIPGSASPSVLPSDSQRFAGQSLRKAHPRQSRSLRVRAANEAPAVDKVVEKIRKKLDEIEDDNVLAFCSLDKGGKRYQNKQTLGEKEQDFLDALRSFYYDNKPNMSNEEFDNLKEELLWAGSKVAILSSTEQRFMEASLSYLAGKPVLSDSEYDKLKSELRKKNSKVVQQGPRCSIRSRTVYTDCDPDYLKMTLLNVPATLLALGALFSIDDLTGFEITKLLELPQPYGIVAVWGIALPAIFVISSSLTNIVLKDGLILKGPCPNCNTDCTTYFGDILTIPGSRDKMNTVCGNCKAKLSFDADKRQITVTEAPGGGSKSGNNKPSPKKGDSNKQPATA